MKDRDNDKTEGKSFGLLLLTILGVGIIAFAVAIAYLMGDRLSFEARFGTTLGPLACAVAVVFSLLVATIIGCVIASKISPS
jgi:hypothetical protein